MESMAAVDARSLTQLTPKILAVTVSAWDRILSHIQTGDLEEAYSLAAKTREMKSVTFPIGAAEIALAWKRKTRPELKSAGDAWAIACQAIRSTPDDYTTGVPKRGKPKIDDPVIAKCVRSIGVDRIAINDKNEAWKAFEWMYKAEADAENERIDVNPDRSMIAESERLRLVESNTLAISGESVDREIVAAVTTIFGEECDDPLAKIRAMRAKHLAEPAPKRESKGTVCGNCHYVSLKHRTLITYFCRHEDVRLGEEFREVGHDGTTAPEWCPLKKAS